MLVLGMQIASWVRNPTMLEVVAFGHTRLEDSSLRGRQVSDLFRHPSLDRLSERGPLVWLVPLQQLSPTP